jgi:hypothetical protein
MRINLKVPVNLPTLVNRNEIPSNLNKTVDETLKYYDDLVSTYGSIFDDLSPNLKYHIKDKVEFTRGMDNVNLTKLVRSFDISGKEIFLAMTKNTEEYSDMWDKRVNDKSSYIHFDYAGPFRMKCCLPINNEHYNIDTEINIRRYDNIKGIKRLIELFEDKIKHPEKSYDIPEEKPIRPYKEEEEIIEIPEILPERTQYYFSHNEDNVYPMDEHEEYNNFYNENMEKGNFNLTKYFKYVKRIDHDNYGYTPTLDDYILCPRYSTTLKDLSITSCIIFGVDRIRIIDVEKLISCIRFRCDGYSYDVDNFTISVYGKHIMGLIDDERKLFNMEFVQYADFLTVAKWIVQVMNHINPDKINKHNYKVMVDYCKIKDQFDEAMIYKLPDNERRRIASLTFL